MKESNRMDLEARLARLERLVDNLYSARAVEPLGDDVPGEEPQAPGKRASPARLDWGQGEPKARTEESGEERAKGTADSDSIRTDWRHPEALAGRTEQWLGRVGVGFVILALAFLLKLSFDRGWITPSLRLAAGFGTGGALLYLGLRLGPARQRLEQALLGGSIALFYLSGFAGFQLYELLPFWVALSVMSTTTVLSIVLSERQESALLAVMGVSGGLATPFLLESGSGDVNALVIYASLVLLGGGVVHFRKGWGALLAAMLVGGSIVMTMVAFTAGDGERLLPIIGILIFWFVVGVSPLLRPAIQPGSVAEGIRAYELWALRTSTGIGIAVSAFLIGVVQGFDADGFGYLFLASGAVLSALAYLVRRVRISLWPAAEVAALCIAVGLWLAVGDSPALFLILAEAWVLQVLVRHSGPTSLGPLGHGMGAMVAVGFLHYAGNAPWGSGLLGFREGVLFRMGILAILTVIPRWTAAGEKPWYLGSAYVGLLILFWAELNPLALGPQLVTLAWSVQGAVALVASVRRESHSLQLAGLGTLGLVAGKLLLVDLSQLDPAWRILMFFCFGVGLLGLAYLVNRPRNGGEPPTSS